MKQQRLAAERGDRDQPSTLILAMFSLFTVYTLVSASNMFVPDLPILGLPVTSVKPSATLTRLAEPTKPISIAQTTQTIGGYPGQSTNMPDNFIVSGASDIPLYLSLLTVFL